MNINNVRPKKCSGQSRYGRYGSYATAMCHAKTNSWYTWKTTVFSKLPHTRLHKCISAWLITKWSLADMHVQTMKPCWQHCSWSALEASHSIHEASWPTLSLYEQPGFHAVLETAQTKLCCPPLVQTMFCLSSRNVHVTWEQGYAFGHLLLSISEHHSTTAHGPPCSI